MRWSPRLSLSSATALGLLLGSAAFSAPVRRLASIVTSDGLFQQAIAASNITDMTSFANTIANTLSSDPSICAPVQQLLQALIAGESDAGGVNSIGDRAIVGARKLLGLTNAPLSDVLNDLATGTYQPNVLTAMQQAVQNPAKTIASLQTYKFLVDTQSALLNLTTTVTNIGGNSSISQSIQDAIAPALQSVESTIDKIGADFSVQNLSEQHVDIQNILGTLSTASSNVTALEASNKMLATSITDATKTATTAMDNLVTSAKSAAAIAASSTPVIADDVFVKSPPPGTACK